MKGRAPVISWLPWTPTVGKDRRHVSPAQHLGGPNPALPTANKKELAYKLETASPELTAVL